MVSAVNVVVGIPSFGMVSTYFMQARISQQFPLVSSAIDKIVLNRPIAEARNEIVEYALQQGANYIYWLDDDVLAPPDAFLKMFMHQKDIVNGVYWSKSNPPMPLLFRGHLQGPYLDWHVGDLIEIDAAGNGLTLVKTDVYRNIPEPWYSTEYVSFPGVKQTLSPSNNTEDLYFYWKARNAGYKIWADTSIQAFHFDKTNNVAYAMPPNSPQANPEWAVNPQGEKMIADIGSGPVSPHFEEGKVVSFDIREDMKPDVVCDVRKIPVPDETFDIVFSSHTLEHFSWLQSDKILKEWTRILKVGGEMRIVVPNVRFSAQRIYEDRMIPHDMWVLYGEQDYAKNYHAAGFTPNAIQKLFESLGCFDDIQVREGNVDSDVPGPDSWNLQIKATKTRNLEIENITPDNVEPTIATGNFMPVRLYQNYNIKEMTDQAIADDLAKWMGDVSEGIKPDKKVEVSKTERAGGWDLLFPEGTINGKSKEELKGEANGLDSDNKNGRTAPRAKRGRKRDGVGATD